MLSNKFNNEDLLTNSFSKATQSNIISFEEAVHFSLFKSDNHILESNPSINDFTINNDSVRKVVNCKEESAFSLKSVKIETREKSTCGFSNEVLFSGYFGQKAEDENFNGQILFNKSNHITNPFPLIEEEKVYNNCNTSFNSMNRFTTKRQKLENFNTASTGKNYFTELVKSVSLGNLQRKKSIKSLI